MKILLNTTTNRIVWRGREYLVDGQPGVVDPPMVLLTEVRFDPPRYDPDTEKLLTIPDGREGDEWHMGRFDIVALTPEETIARTVPAEQPAWRIRAVAKLTPYGEETLHTAVLSLIDLLPDPEKTVASEIYTGGNLLARESALLQQVAAALQLTDEQVHNLFIAASQLPT